MTPVRSAYAPARRDPLEALLAFAAYLALSLMFFGRALEGHLFDYYVGRDTDPSLYMWSLAWWPYVISHHVHPFFTRLVWAPNGINLALVTCMPLLGIIAAPLTTALGPLATYNLIALAVAPMCAWTAYLLCRRLCGAFVPALIGGLIFGFSPYCAGQMLSHMCELLVFPIPLAIYLAVRRFQGSLSRSGFVLWLSATLVTQFLLNLEFFATTAFIGGIAFLIALRVALARDRSRHLLLAGEIAAAYALTAVLMSPYLYCFFAYGYPHQPLWPAWTYSADLLNFVIPTAANAVGANRLFEAVSGTFPGNIYEQGACVGLPLIAIAALWGRRHLGEFRARLLLATLIAICVLAAGPFLQVAGRAMFPMPWLLVEKLPLVRNAIPVRLMGFAFLALAIIFTLWFCDPRTGRIEKAAGAAAVLLMLLPNPAASFWASPSPLPAFFRDGSSQRLLSPDDIVLPLPYGQKGMCMMWQALGGMNFRMASGLTGLMPVEVRRWPLISVLFGSNDLPDSDTQLKACLANLEVTAIIIDASDARVPQWKELFSPLGIAPVEISGVILYRIPPGALQRYRSLSAIEMEQRADRAHFEALISATARYLAGGGAIAELSVPVLESAGLFPSAWKFNPRPDAYRDIVSSEVDGLAGLGVIGSPSGLKTLIESYRGDARTVYFPYPRKWTANPPGFIRELLEPPIWGSTSGESMQLMVMTFDVDRLNRLAARVAAQTAITPASPPRAASR